MTIKILKPGIVYTDREVEDYFSQIIKGYRIRLYPTKEQEEKFWKHIHACRYIWNYMLEKQMILDLEGEDYLTGYQMISLLTPLKKEEKYKWLSEVASHSLQRTCLVLAETFSLYLKKKSNFPKFKSKKKSKSNFPTSIENFYFVNNKLLNIEKVGKVKYKSNFNFPHGFKIFQFINPKVSYVNGKWFVSFGVRCEKQTPKLNDISMGIDLGIKSLAVVEYNNSSLIFNNINKSKKIKDLEKKKKYLQRKISRKYEMNRQGKTYIKTNNIKREEEKLRKLYAKLSNIRHNYIHQTTHYLTYHLLPKRIVMEDLNIMGMIKNSYLSKSVFDQCLYEFIRQMKYKCDWNGIEFIQADRMFPSSKTCSKCGNIKKDLKLSDRIYKCPICGNKIDRDYNAAVNLSRYVV